MAAIISFFRSCCKKNTSLQEKKTEGQWATFNEPIPFTDLITLGFTRNEIDNKYQDQKQAALEFYKYVEVKYGEKAKQFIVKMDIIAHSFDDEITVTELLKIDDEVKSTLKNIYGEEKTNLIWASVESRRKSHEMQLKNLMKTAFNSRNNP